MQEWPKAKALAKRVKELSKTDKIILGFSRGKDAIGAAIELKRYFDVIPVYYQSCPGLSFVEDSLAYYEKHLFGRKIHRVTHPNLFRNLRSSYVFQDYVGFFEVTQFLSIPYDVEEVRKYVCRLEGISPNVYTATGVRANDNVTRRTAIAKHGPISVHRRSVHFIWDWDKARLISEIEGAGIKLPYDYALWGRTFDGLSAKWTIPLKRNLPDDYERLKRRFPLIDADIIRYSRIRHEQGMEVV